MKTFKLIFFAALFLVAVNINAQDKKVTFGVKAGLNVSNIGAEDKAFDNTSAKTGFHAGITLDYAFTHQWYLLTGLEYSSKGVKIDLGGSSDLNVTAAYVQLPLCAGFKLGITDDLGILFDLGPYFAYGLHGKSKIGSSEIDTFSKDWVKKFDCGIHFGVGLEWQKMTFGFGGESGMVNIMQEGNSKAETRNFKVSVGYKF